MNETTRIDALRMSVDVPVLKISEQSESCRILYHELAAPARTQYA